jgi:hypothetical protein
MPPQNRSDARHVCYGRPTNQAINQLAKDIKIRKTKQNEKQCRCCLNQNTRWHMQRWSARQNCSKKGDNGWTVTTKIGS